MDTSTNAVARTSATCCFFIELQAERIVAGNEVGRVMRDAFPVWSDDAAVIGPSRSGQGKAGVADHIKTDGRDVGINDGAPNDSWSCTVAQSISTVKFKIQGRLFAVRLRLGFGSVSARFQLTQKQNNGGKRMECRIGYAPANGCHLAASLIALYRTRARRNRAAVRKSRRTALRSRPLPAGIIIGPHD